MYYTDDDDPECGRCGLPKSSRHHDPSQATRGGLKMCVFLGQAPERPASNPEPLANVLRRAQPNLFKNPPARRSMERVR